MNIAQKTKDITKFVQEKATELTQVLDGIVNDPSIDREKRMQLIIHTTALTCALVAIQPIPFADLFVLTPIQVVMIMFLSQVMGNPIGKHGAQEIITYIISVICFGVLAQQVVLGLYKTIIPFMGAVTTIPLVYSATYGLGVAAKIILQARLEDQEISRKELKKAVAEAEKEAKKQGDLTIKGLMEQLRGLKKKADEYQQFKQRFVESEKELDRYRKLLARQTAQYDSVLQEIQQFDSIGVIEKQIALLEKRWSQYSSVRINYEVYKHMALASKEEVYAFEDLISRLHSEPGKVRFTNAIAGTSIKEIEIENLGRIHLTMKASEVEILFIETPANNIISQILKEFQSSSAAHWNNRHLMNEEIKEKFHYSLKNAKAEIDIVSPWIGPWVTKENFYKLFDDALRKGVQIKILYGIKDSSGSGKRKDGTFENAKELKELLGHHGDRLRMKKSNTHYKLLICDDSYYIQGSYNFLSFMGFFDKDTRSEGAEYSENPEILRRLRKIYFNF